jgi:RNA polymerase sigma factor (sigma-70 family)
MDSGGIRTALRHLRTLAAVRSMTALADGELLARFAEAGDEAAFTALVERHAPMVLRVCRRVLGHPQDAEDACQATFLVLVRKAASVRKRGSAANWLYGVADRTARQLRAGRARRERVRAGQAEAAVPADEGPSWREVRHVLDEELGRLSEKYRAPLELCYLEGLTRDEAARRLGLEINRFRGRLDYGRTLLRARLTRRGIAPSAALLVGLLTREATAAVPANLVISTVRAAALIAAGRAVPAGMVPARVAALAEGVVHTMFLTKLKLVCVALILTAGLGGGASAIWHSATAAAPAVAGGAPATPPVSAVAGEKPKGGGPAEPLKKMEHPFDKPLAALSKTYALPDGEVLKCFRPPFPEVRKELMRLGYVNPPDEPNGYLDLHWRDGRLVFGTLTGTTQDLRTLLTALAGLYPQEVEAEDALLMTAIGADFVVREGAPPAKVVARLEEILNNEFAIPLKLTLREEERKVHVLSGKYQFKAVAPDQERNRIELYAENLSDPKFGGGGSGNFAEFAQWLGRFVSRRVVVGKVEGVPARLSWHDDHPDKAFSQEEWEAAHAAEPVLKHVAEQTGLTIREETRRVRVLVVERK